ncbi:uncharacterized protein LOC124269983 isoform X1 [Haliotis rubra]|uniref:uncharacterized protein LOC124269983 isoform X1 n=1 Tax=Haliotis rubra TaxID=36100 RepID=UPI001EE60214|nr:uncharacterized protein LOC124269983 isoform X1 [Haliotis rubra]
MDETDMEILFDGKHGLSLKQGLNRLYKDKALCDVTLTSSDGVDIQAHWLVLAAHSDFLQHLAVNRNVVLSDTGSLKLNIESEILKMMLNYLYTGELVVTKDTLHKIKMAAKVLQLSKALALLEQSHLSGLGDQSFEAESKILQPTASLQAPDLEQQQLQSPDDQGFAVMGTLTQSPASYGQVQSMQSPAPFVQVQSTASPMLYSQGYLQSQHYDNDSHRMQQPATVLKEEASPLLPTILSVESISDSQTAFSSPSFSNAYLDQRPHTKDSSHEHESGEPGRRRSEPTRQLLDEGQIVAGKRPGGDRNARCLFMSDGKDQAVIQTKRGRPKKKFNVNIPIFQCSSAKFVTLSTRKNMSATKKKMNQNKSSGSVVLEAVKPYLCQKRSLNEHKEGESSHKSAEVAAEHMTAQNKCSSTRDSVEVDLGLVKTEQFDGLDYAIYENPDTSDTDSCGNSLSHCAQDKARNCRARKIITSKLQKHSSSMSYYRFTSVLRSKYLLSQYVQNMCIWKTEMSPFRCKVCKRGFKHLSSLKYHCLSTHLSKVRRLKRNLPTEALNATQPTITEGSGQVGEWRMSRRISTQQDHTANISLLQSGEDRLNVVLDNTMPSTTAGSTSREIEKKHFMQENSKTKEVYISPRYPCSNCGKPFHVKSNMLCHFETCNEPKVKVEEIPHREVIGKPKKEPKVKVEEIPHRKVIGKPKEIASSRRTADVKKLSNSQLSLLQSGEDRLNVVLDNSMPSTTAGSTSREIEKKHFMQENSRTKEPYNSPRYPCSNCGKPFQIKSNMLCHFETCNEPKVKVEEIPHREVIGEPKKEPKVKDEEIPHRKVIGEPKEITSSRRTADVKKSSNSQLSLLQSGEDRQHVVLDNTMPSTTADSTSRESEKKHFMQENSRTKEVYISPRYPCSNCGKPFHFKSNMLRHFKTCNEPKVKVEEIPHREVIGEPKEIASSRRTADVKKSSNSQLVRLYTNGATCTLCNKTFTRSDTTIRHIRTVHFKQKYTRRSSVFQLIRKHVI